MHGHRLRSCRHRFGDVCASRICRRFQIVVEDPSLRAEVRGERALEAEIGHALILFPALPGKIVLISAHNSVGACNITGRPEKHLQAVKNSGDQVCKCQAGARARRSRF